MACEQLILIARVLKFRRFQSKRSDVGLSETSNDVDRIATPICFPSKWKTLNEKYVHTGFMSAVAKFSPKCSLNMRTCRFYISVQVSF